MERKILLSIESGEVEKSDIEKVATRIEQIKNEMKGVSNE